LHPRSQSDIRSRKPSDAARDWLIIPQVIIESERRKNVDDIALTKVNIAVIIQDDFC